MSSPANDPAFAGVAQVYNQTISSLDRDEIDDDISGEQETVMNPNAEAARFAQLEDAVLEASKGVGEGTDGEYKRYALRSKIYEYL